MSLTIPQTPTPIPTDQTTITVAAFEQPVFVIGPQPYPKRNSIVRRLLLGLFDAAWQTGLAMGALALLLATTALVWPSFGRYLEDFGWFVGEQIALVIDAIKQ
jgi:hypothetical protein